MGKHSSSSQWPFYRSVLGWVLPWLLVAALAAVGIWIAVDALGNDDLKTPEVASATETPTPTPTTQTPASPRPSKTPKTTPSPDESEPTPTTALITENMTVQVLNATSDTSADDRMADQLSQEGFEVVAVAGASTQYELTTVFWSYEESRAAAEALAARFGWQVGAKPENLSTTVALHIVVGLDYL